MKLLLHKTLVFIAFSLLLAHNFTPHHHHHALESEQTYHHDEGEHGHHHHPFSFFSVDENFVFQSFNLKITAPPTIAAAVPSFGDIGTITKAAHPGFLSTPCGHPPAPPFLLAFSFRGSPKV
jgi:hypothetical protein